MHFPKYFTSGCEPRLEGKKGRQHFLSYQTRNNTSENGCLLGFRTEELPNIRPPPPPAFSFWLLDGYNHMGQLVGTVRCHYVNPHLDKQLFQFGSTTWQIPNLQNSNWDHFNHFDSCCRGISPAAMNDLLFHVFYCSVCPLCSEFGISLWMIYGIDCFAY